MLFFASDFSSSGYSHVGCSLPLKRNKGLACDIFDRLQHVQALFMYLFMPITDAD